MRHKREHGVVDRRRPPERERLRLLKRDELTIDQLVAEAKRAEIITRGLQSDFWTEVLGPALEERGTRMLELLIRARGLEKDEWERAQHAALEFETLFKYITGLQGQQKQLLEEAESKSRKLEEAEASRDSGKAGVRDGRKQRNPE